MPDGHSAPATRRMIDAFVSDDRARDEWHYALQQILAAKGCPCTTTTHIVPRMRSATTGGMWMEDGAFVPGRPVRSCGLCKGLGVDARRWADYPPTRAEVAGA